MISYVVKAKKNPMTGELKYYPQIASVSALTLLDITEKISSACTVTEHDVKAVLSALQEQVKIALREGHSVRLGDLGSFRPTIVGSGAATREEVSVSNINAVRVRYTRSGRLEAELNKGQTGVKFSRATDAATAAEGAADTAEVTE